MILRQSLTPFLVVADCGIHSDLLLVAEDLVPNDPLEVVSDPPIIHNGYGLRVLLHEFHANQCHRKHQPSLLKWLR